jgi:hypothetical protein
MGYSVNHQRGGFQRVNFRVISSPLGVKVLISAEEAIKWGKMGSDLQNLHNNGVRLAKLE